MLEKNEAKAKSFPCFSLKLKLVFVLMTTYLERRVSTAHLSPTIGGQFMLKSPIKVMRADLLEKEQGVSELYRNTYVKAIMRGDGSFLVLWAGKHCTSGISLSLSPQHLESRTTWSQGWESR